MSRARDEGVERIETLSFRSGVRPAADMRDVRTLRSWLPGADILHVHRGKEHWLAAIANRRSPQRRPLVRTRHIVQPIRPHALNRWLYGRATDLVVTVSEAIRRQCLAAGLAPPDRVVALPGGADGEKFKPGHDGAALRQELGLASGVPLVGLLSGFRVMKGHGVVVDAAAEARRLGARLSRALRRAGALQGRDPGERGSRGPRRPGLLPGLRRRSRPGWSDLSTSRSTRRSSPTGCRACSSNTWRQAARSSPAVSASRPKC